MTAHHENNGHMELPRELRPFVGARGVTDRSGHSSAKVYETRAGFFIKCDELGELAREHRMTDLFFRLGLGPEPVRYLSADRDYLVTRKTPGRDLTKALDDPVCVCRLLADALKALHTQPTEGAAIPVSSRYERYMASADGPFSGGCYDPSVYMDPYRLSSREEAWEVMQRGRHLLRCDTLIHGDACLPNVIEENGAFRSFIDVGMGGLGDRHIDLYWAIWSLHYNFGTDAYADAFLGFYGRESVREETFRVVAAFEAFG